MKTYHSWLYLLLCVALLCALGFGCRALSDAGFPGEARIVKIKGMARYSGLKRPAWREARCGDVLKAGSVLQTEQAKGAFLDFDLGPQKTALFPSRDQPEALPSWDRQAERALQPCPRYVPKPAPNLVRVWENTTLKLEQLADEDRHGALVAPHLRLVFGHLIMIGDWSALGPEAAVSIGFTNGVIRMRRGACELRSSGELNVARGTVTVILEEKHLTLEVSAGQGFNPATGKVFDLPRDATRD